MIPSVFTILNLYAELEGGDTALTTDGLPDNLVKDNDGTLIPCGNNVFTCNLDGKSGIANCAGGKGVFSLAQGSLQTVVGQGTLGSTATPSVPVSSATSSASHNASSASSSSTSTPTAVPAHKPKAGVIAGPVVAAIAILALIIGLLCWFFPRWPRQRPTTPIHMNPSPRPGPVYGNGDANTFASETSTRAPFPHPYPPPISPAPQMNRSEPHIFGNLGVREDDPYKPVQTFSVPRRELGELGQ